MIKKKFLVCCGTGIATSVQVAAKLKEVMKERGIQALTAECKASEIASKVETSPPDVIVATAEVRVKPGGPRVFRGVPFLTGVGEEELADDIANYLKSGG
ncbi:PTS sugar transporter subunit IIB [Stomatohabitans albus]|uniref:PTS sugar transporter subunit IIB n=1 Tax=Stomatohabitans albus TaxID=3110766 RepID=UPI00300C0AEB